MGVNPVGVPLVPLEEASVLSMSRLKEAPEVVVDPVRVGECILDSLTGEGADVGDVSKALSLPVTASDIARRPIRPFGADPGLAVDDRRGTLDGKSPLSFGADVTMLILGFWLYSSLVTVGEVSSFKGTVVAKMVSLALELRNLPFKLFP